MTSSEHFIQGEIISECNMEWPYKAVWLQAQQSELQSLLRLTQSTEEEQGQEAHTASFRALVLDRAIPQSLAVYVLTLFAIPILEVAEDKNPADVLSSTQPSDIVAPSAGSAQETSSVASVNAPERVGEGADETPATTSGSADPAGTAGTAGDSSSRSPELAQSTASVAGSANTAGKAGLGGSAGTAGSVAELCKQGSKQWSSAMEQAGLPWALQLLAAFARRHQVPMQCYMSDCCHPAPLLRLLACTNFTVSS